MFDFLREYNLTSDQALEVSDHMPVWAEFSVYEGGQPGRIATVPGTGRGNGPRVLECCVKAGTAGL